MTHPIRWLLIGLLLNGLSSSEGQAATVNAASCSVAAVQTAINTAANGDTVVIPNGSCTWTSGITTSKQITITGQAKGAVLIAHSAGGGDLFAITTGSSFNTRVSNINFLAGSGTGHYLDISGSGKPPVIHDNYFRVPDGQLAHSISHGRNGGVFHHNTFDSLSANGTESGNLQLKDTSGTSTSWSTPSTMGMNDTNGTANTYIEDNVFNAITLQAIDIDDNARVVIRHNTFNDSSMTIHGCDTSFNSGRHYEIYDNTFVYHLTPAGGYNYPLNVANGWIFPRAGTGVIQGNAMDNINSVDWGNKPEVKMMLMSIHRSGPGSGCGCSGATYPASQQIGRGNGNALEPLYIWGNSGIGLPEFPSKDDFTPDQCGRNYVTYTTANYVQLGRDYFTAIAKPGYTKFTYPHPLTLSGPAPSPPSGLRAP